MRTAVITVILMAFIRDVSAAGTNGVWNWDQDSSSYFAGTSNESGATFGQACYPGERKCYWLIGVKRPCNANATHPVLANTDSGASTFRITCMGQSDQKAIYRYSINEFDDIDQFVANATRIGFALPLQGDQFQTVRFDLTGSKPIVEEMRQAAQAQMKALPAR